MENNSETDGFVVIKYGPMEIDGMSRAADLVGPGAVIDPDVARMAGASFACGSKAALADLRRRLEAGALHDVRSASSDLSAPAVAWLATGRRGASSESIFAHLIGGGLEKAKDHPYDPGDVGRCRRLMEEVPELQGRIGEMADVSPQWAALVERWDEICAEIDAEARNLEQGRGRSGRAYKLIRLILESDVRKNREKV